MLALLEDQHALLASRWRTVGRLTGDPVLRLPLLCRGDLGIHFKQNCNFKVLPVMRGCSTHFANDVN